MSGSVIQQQEKAIEAAQAIAYIRTKRVDAGVHLQFFCVHDGQVIDVTEELARVTRSRVVNSGSLLSRGHGANHARHIVDTYTGLKEMSHKRVYEA